MYKIELTRGSGWNPAVVETHTFAETAHIAEVQRLANRLFEAAWRKPRGADSYRILDGRGRVVKVGP